ncbi:MAG: hypothetical protein COV48_03690, partial [Elusimicrobia bacterium CG11_big_fil_rev_8_21_14_0_20_64_6]
PYHQREDWWLPFFFWVYGAFMNLYRDPLFSPRLLSVVLGSLSLLPFYGVARRMSDGRRWGALLATCAAALTPLGFEAGFDVYFEPLFVLLLLSWLYFWLRWLESSRALWHGLSVLCLAAAAMTRYEAWFFVAAFLALTRRHRLYGWRCLTAGPVLLCLVHQLVSSGHLQFLADTSNPAESRWGHIESVLEYVFLGGALLPLALLGYLKTGLRRAERCEALGLTVAPLVLFIAAVLVLNSYNFAVHLLPFQMMILLWIAPLAEEVLRGVPQERRVIIFL